MSLKRYTADESNDLIQKTTAAAAVDNDDDDDACAYTCTRFKKQRGIISLGSQKHGSQLYVRMLTHCRCKNAP